MKKYGIFYGSATGTTADVARRIARKLGVPDEDIHDVGTTAPDRLGDYEVIIIGSSTHGNGDLEDEMADFIDGAEALDLSGRKIALFGCGDASMYDTFCDAVGELRHRLAATGAAFIGEFPADCYDFKESKARNGDTMYGLCIDDVNNPELTDRRISLWTDEVKSES